MSPKVSIHQFTRRTYSAV